jgi:hypothetical protein
MFGTRQWRVRRHKSAVDGEAEQKAAGQDERCRGNSNAKC